MKTVQRLGLLVGLIFVSAFVLEEIHIGKGQGYIANQYQRIVYRKIDVIRDKATKKSIGIVIVVERKEDEKNYEMALDTVRCYAIHFGYNIHVIYLKEHPELAEKCKHKDFMFRRHCALSLFMEVVENEWILFIDADMGVINPNKTIEIFVPNDDTTQLVFYNRIMNQEVMAGSYLARNNEYTRKFLMFWADYEARLPDSFHGSDNGAIHSVIVEFALPEEGNRRKHCEKKYWQMARSYEGLTAYEVCMQKILRRNKISRIKIWDKGRFAWARDGWLTDNVWSNSDFIVHGWQKKRLDTRVFAEWHSPLVYDHPFNMSLCETQDAHLNWRFKNTFIGSTIDVDRKIYAHIQKQNTEFNRVLKLIT